ncbi:MAG: glutamate racemase [Cyanobacteria bacterium J06635_15]
MAKHVPLSAVGPDPARIGIFDSGLGGLTVLREVYRQLPNESVLYFGDTARVPYGDRSEAEILQFVREIMTWMTHCGVKMVLMACNTSSATVLEIIQAEFSVPVLGIVLPGARAAARAGQRIGVIATPITAASNAYGRAIAEVDPNAQVWQVGCPKFVPLIEQNRIDDPYTPIVTRTYLEPLIQRNIDTLVYGCTHYPYLEPILSQILPTHVQKIDPAVHVVAAASQELDVLGLRSSTKVHPTRFCVSGDPLQFQRGASQWLDRCPMVEQIALPTTKPQAVPQRSPQD